MSSVASPVVPAEMSTSAAEQDSLEPVRREWLRRIEAEYRSSAITQHLTLWLMQMTAPFELIRMGLRIVDDELVHSELSQKVYASAGGTQGVELLEASLGLTPPANQALAQCVARCCIETYCLGETAAVRLFHRLREGCGEPSARAALDRILVDEVRHREFGWTLLEWLLASPHEAVTRALINQELAGMFARQRKSYAYDQRAKSMQRTRVQQNWGMMPGNLYGQALHETFERDYVPRFEEFDVDVRAAWGA